VVGLSIAFAEELVDNTERDAKEGLPVQYGLMMDAGSTGSRVHTYRYLASISTQICTHSGRFAYTCRCFRSGGFGGAENCLISRMTIILRLDPPKNLMRLKRKKEKVPWQQRQRGLSASKTHDCVDAGQARVVFLRKQSRGRRRIHPASPGFCSFPRTLPYAKCMRIPAPLARVCHSLKRALAILRSLWPHARKRG
jgi:hypothetical protein